MLSQHALLVVSQHALQQISRGVPAPGGCLLQGVCSGGGVPAPRRGGVPARGVPALGRCGLLLWPSGMAFRFGGLLIEGGLLVESGLLLWPSDVIFCYGLLVWPSGKAFWYWEVS